MSNQFTCVGQSNVQDSNLVHLRSKRSPVSTTQWHEAAVHKPGSHGRLFKGFPGNSLAAGTLRAQTCSSQSPLSVASELPPAHYTSVTDRQR